LIKIEKDILEMKQQVIEVRRALHKIPEPGLQENETTEFIIK
jgi:metal-dependent amidase/aminoacylase/carboxypeptidase family protein